LRSYVGRESLGLGCGLIFEGKKICGHGGGGRSEFLTILIAAFDAGERVWWGGETKELWEKIQQGKGGKEKKKKDLYNMRERNSARSRKQGGTGNTEVYSPKKKSYGRGGALTKTGNRVGNQEPKSSRLLRAGNAKERWERGPSAKGRLTSKRLEARKLFISDATT